MTNSSENSYDKNSIPYQFKYKRQQRRILILTLPLHILGVNKAHKHAKVSQNRYLLTCIQYLPIVDIIQWNVYFG